MNITPTLPHDEEFELFALQIAFAGDDKSDELLNLLDSHCFYNTIFQKIYQKCKEAFIEGKKANLRVVLQIMKDQHKFNFDDNLSTRIDSMIEAMFIEAKDVADRLINLSSKRRIIQKCGTVVANINEENEACLIIDDLQKELVSIKDDAISESSCHEKNIETFNKMLDGKIASTLSPTGLYWLDNLIPFEKGWLHVLAGVQGGGKTAMALNIALSRIRQSEIAVLFICESQAVNIYKRLINMLTGVPMKMITEYHTPVSAFEVRQKELVKQAWKFIEALLNEKLFIFGSTDFNKTTADIIKKCYKIEKDHGSIAHIFVDHIQRLKAPRGLKPSDELLILKENTHDLHELAQTRNCVVTLLSQFNKQGKQGRPTGSALRGSSVMEDEAHIITMLYSSDPTDMSPVRPIDFYTTKGRDFGGFSETLAFVGSRLTFDGLYHTGHTLKEMGMK